MQAVLEDCTPPSKLRLRESTSLEVVFKIQETCNLNCTYCYMYNLGNDLHKVVPKFASLETCVAVADFMADELLAHDLSSARLVLHGGEPLLMPAHRFAERMEAIWARLSERLPASLLGRVGFGMQTNATLVSDAWIDQLARWKINIGVSIDGPAWLNDRRRQDHHGLGSHAAALAGIRRLQEAVRAGSLPGVGGLCVIDPAADGAELYRYLSREVGLRSFDLLLPFMTWETHDPNVVAGVGRFLRQAFLAWREDEFAARVRIFERAMKVLRHRGANAADVDEVAVGHMIVIVESDGSISPEETLRETTKERVTSRRVTTSRMRDLLEDEVFAHVLLADRTWATECRGCVLLENCRSGHGLGRIGQRFSGTDYQRKTVYCDAFQEVFVGAAALLTDGGKSFDRLAAPHLANEADLAGVST